MGSAQIRFFTGVFEVWWWDYSHLTEPFAYGPDTTYEAAAKFLEGGPVEDWGCGTCYARKFFPKGYVGVDRANTFADVVGDLRYLKIRPDKFILLRHVLEHNEDWEKILGNAVSSSKKLAIVVFTPFGEETKIINWTENQRGKVPDISFRKEDLTRYFPKFTEQSFETGIAYGAETLFCVETC